SLAAPPRRHLARTGVGLVPGDHRSAPAAAPARRIRAAVRPGRTSTRRRFARRAACRMVAAPGLGALAPCLPRRRAPPRRPPGPRSARRRARQGRAAGERAPVAADRRRRSIGSRRGPRRYSLAATNAPLGDPLGGTGQVAGGGVFLCAWNLSTLSFLSVGGFADALAHQPWPLASVRRTATCCCWDSSSEYSKAALPP